MFLEKVCIMPVDWVPASKLGGTEEITIVLDKVVAVGETVHAVPHPSNAAINCAYFFYVYLQGQPPVRLAYETREKAALRLKETKAIVARYLSGQE